MFDGLWRVCQVSPFLSKLMVVSHVVFSPREDYVKVILSLHIFFLLCGDAFSLLLAKAARENHIHGANICKGEPRVSQLFFADNSILFARAILENVLKLLILLVLMTEHVVRMSI